MRKLLITHNGHSEVPLIVAAKNMGWHVIAVGDNPKAVGTLFADENIIGAFEDPQFIVDVATKHKVDAIVSGCEDAAYLSAAYACDVLGLPGHDSYETACIIHHKTKFRQAMEQFDLPTPKFKVCNNFADAEKAAEDIGYPLLVKPADKNSGVGITICEKESDLKGAFDLAMETTELSGVILEEFLNGSKHAANVLLSGGRVVQSFFDDEQYYLNPYLVAGASSPSGLGHYTMAHVVNYIERLAEGLDLVDGMFHVQFITRADGTPILIDPCRRIPGGLYLLLIRYAGGYDCAEAVVRYEIGEKSRFELTRYEKQFVAREYIMTDRNGVIKDIRIDDSIKDRIVDRFIWARQGDMVKDFLDYKAGILWLKFDSYAEMQEVLNNYHELVKIVFE